MTDHGAEPTIEQIAALAEILGVAIRPEHLAETAQAWRLMEAHRQRVGEAELSQETEPAPVFRP
jgi:hypothetical protein